MPSAQDPSDLFRDRPGGETELVGTVSRVTFHAEETGYTVLRVSPEGEVAHEEGIGEFAVLQNRKAGRPGDAAELDYGMIDDDYMLGARIAKSGGRVVLSPYIVETRVAEPSLRALFFHELRWARTMRAVRPVGYFLAAVTYGFVWSALALAVSGAAWPALLATAGHVTARLTVHVAARRTLGTRDTAPSPWLLPVRDLFSLVLWAASFTGRTVRWGRHRFVVDAWGRLARR